MIQIKINNPIEGSVIYTPRDYQKKLLDELQLGKNIQLYSARQMGVSTTLMYFILNKCMEIENYQCLILYPNTNSAIGWKSEYANSGKQWIEKHTKNSITFKNGSSIQFLSVESDYAGNRYVNSEIFVEYFKFMNQLKFNSFLLSTDESCKFRFYSVPNEQILGYEQIKWNYTLNPEFNQPGWSDRQKEILGDSRFSTEFEIQ